MLTRVLIFIAGFLVGYFLADLFYRRKSRIESVKLKFEEKKKQ